MDASSEGKTLVIPDQWDRDTIHEMIVEIESFLDYEEQSGRLDDRTREGFVVALEVMGEVRNAYDSIQQQRR